MEDPGLQLFPMESLECRYRAGRNHFSASKNRAVQIFYPSISSAKAIAAAASMQGTARIATQGSCRPCMVNDSGELWRILTDAWGCAIDGVGLKATRNTTGTPVDSPPRIPP